MPILNYTTEVKADKSVAEIQQMLTRNKARRVGWRIIKDAIEVQLALVECGQSEMAEAFFEYLVVDRSGLSVYKQFKEHNQKLLAASPK